MHPKHLRATPTGRKISRAVTVPVVLALAVAGVATPAFAGKPARGGSGSSSISVAVLDGADQTPNFGETITFNVTSSTYKKWVDLYCYQDGTFVYSSTHGFFAEYPWAPNYALSSAYWTGGAASCDARLYTQSSNGKQSTLARLTFSVSA